MYPQAQGLHLDVEAISGILGSISIACWVVVFSPQIIENFRRGSAEGLSLTFIVIWLLGDVFNILGAVLQGVLPTMIILAVYYTLADLVLFAQCLYYRSRGGSSSSSSALKPDDRTQQAEPDENEPLLSRRDPVPSARDRRSQASALSTPVSAHSASSGFGTIDARHLSPAMPLLEAEGSDPPAIRDFTPRTALQATLFNLSALVLVCAAGAFGWWLSTRSAHSIYHGRRLPIDARPARVVHISSMIAGWAKSTADDEAGTELEMDPLGQVFGYLCAVLYLASRIPQLLLNYRRQSTEGVSMLFFLFACVGNLTYVLSIAAYEPACARIEALVQASGFGDSSLPAGSSLHSGTLAAVASYMASHGSDSGAEGCEAGEWSAEYSRYMLVNLSWLLGSAGTLALDLLIFVQFWWYRGRRAVADPTEH